MNDETRLPEDLQHAVDLIMESDVLHEVAQESADAIRTEHAKRLTLQHHAADMAQRVADLEAERDRLQHAYHQQRDDAQARVCAAIMRALAAEKERDELRVRAELAESRLWVMIERDGARDEQLRQARRERDELRARLAEIEAQEPVAWVRTEWSGSGAKSLQMDKPADALSLADEARGVQYGPLYARPVTAIPAGWKLVPVEPTPEMVDATISAADRLMMEGDAMDEEIRTVWMQMINEAPEHKA